MRTMVKSFADVLDKLKKPEVLPDGIGFALHKGRNRTEKRHLLSSTESGTLQCP
jgi:hypothetical protein